VAGNISILTERRRAILKVVVQEYVRTAQAVSSARVETLSGLGVSSATLRNELASLEEMGYLAQPHTSGGRVPTERGYRYYVEGLMDEPSVPVDEQRTIAHQFHQVQMDLTEWLRLSAAILAQQVQNAALITAPRVAESRVKHLELISIQDSVALLVLVLQGGLVHQQMVVLEMPSTQEILSRAAASLNHRIEGMTATGVDQVAMVLPAGLERSAAAAVARLMREYDEQDVPAVYYDGIANVLGQAEFSVSSQARNQERQQVAQGMIQILEMLQQGLLLRRLLPHVLSGGGVQVFIGGEGMYEDLGPFSVIASRYGAEGGGMGLIGVFGPMRMHYGRAVAVVRYMTDLLSDLAGELHG
jgi:heat-inducible transcriptional repressor